MTQAKSRPSTDQHYPKLRHVDAFPVEVEQETRIYIRDPLNYATEPLLLPYPTYFIISHFDGQHSFFDIQEAFSRQFSQTILREQIQDIISQLDKYYYLEGERFAGLQQEVLDAFRRAPIREMAHADTCYSSQTQACATQLNGFFSDPDGPGALGTEARSVTIQGIIAPHIDLRAGGPCYAWAYKMLAEQCTADVFVLLGTSHYGHTHPFVATEKDYNTPLGLVRTDRDFLRTCRDRYNGDLFVDEALHRTEHSLEFQTLFLQHVMDGKRDFTVVPILVSSFHHMILSQTRPIEDTQIASFISALKRTISDCGRNVCLVAGVDFAHVGQKFGDERELTSEFLDWVKSEDALLIHELEQVNASGFFEQIAKNADQRRVCGAAPMYTFLETIEAGEGKLLKYDRSLDEQTQSSVSFASLAFYGK